jgi:hypothetical protein
MSELADELKQVVGNYTDEYNIKVDDEFVDLIVDYMPSNLMYDIILLARSLNYGFTIRPTLPQYSLELEFYKTL